MEFTAEIVKIKQETHDVKTFRFNKRIDFIPGQYCLVSLKDEAKPFTFSSSPTENFLELTIKKFGEFTTKLHSLKEGSRLKIKGPLGESLNFNESVKEDIAYIAGGSGITPFMSHLKYAVAKNLKNSFILIFSSRTEEDIIFKKELREINKKENITVINTITDDSPKNWKQEKGRIRVEMIEKYINNPEKRQWYLCGPPGMIRAMKEILISIGVNEEKIKIEDWQLPGKHDE